MRIHVPVPPGAQCNWKPGVRDKDGHAWTSTMLGWPWPWRCFYCRKRSRSKIRPDKIA